MSTNGQWRTLVKNKIRNFNLFESRVASEEDLKNQRLSTRIFAVLLLVSTGTLLLYSSMTSVTRTVVVQQPSLIVYNELQQKYPDTLICPCQQPLVPYEKFIVSFKPTFNQICRSDFITTEWLNYVNYRSLPDRKYHLFYDFRHSAYSFFKMLHIICQLISSTIDSQMIHFYSANLFTKDAMSATALRAVANASGKQFSSTTASLFRTLLNSFKTVTQGNNIVNRLGTNWILATEVDHGILYDVAGTVAYSADSNCSCVFTPDCKMTTGIYETYRRNVTELPNYWNGANKMLQGELQFEVDGINVGCLTLQAVLQSNLSCLYNTSCLTRLYNYLHDSPYPINTNDITALHVPSSSLSLPTMQELVNNLMIDQWPLVVSFESYFNMCSSQTCTYTYARQLDVIFMMTTTVSFLGGIVTILMLTILPVVTFFRKSVSIRRPKRSTLTVTPSHAHHAQFLEDHQTEEAPRRLLMTVKNVILELNVFKNPDEETVWHLRSQRLSTRLFLVSMVASLSFLVFFTLFSDTIRTVVVTQPSIDDYITLETQIPRESLVCPCQSISNQYKSFISFQPTLHQICASFFLSQNWLDYLWANTVISNNDFRISGYSFFPTVKLLCNLSTETIIHELLRFNSTDYTTQNVQRRDLFQTEVQETISSFQQTTRNSFLSQVAIFRRSMNGNGLLSGWLTRYHYSLLNSTASLDLSFNPRVYTTVVNGSNTMCSCNFDPDTCDTPSAIYDYSQGTVGPECFSVQ